MARTTALAPTCAIDAHQSLLLRLS